MKYDDMMHVSLSLIVKQFVAGLSTPSVFTISKKKSAIAEHIPMGVITRLTNQ